MGWTPVEEVITIDFTGTRFEGLTVKVEDVDMATISRMMRLSAQVGAKTVTDPDGAANAFDELVNMAGAMLHEWDMEVPEGNPLPPTAESIMILKQRTGLPLINMILKAIQDIGDGLKKDSPSGLSSLAALPMTAP